MENRKTKTAPEKKTDAKFSFELSPDELDLIAQAIKSYARENYGNRGQVKAEKVGRRLCSNLGGSLPPEFAELSKLIFEARSELCGIAIDDELFEDSEH